MSQTFIDRLINEKNELCDKKDKLYAFIHSDLYKNIDPVQQTLLSIQLDVMSTYANVLIERITWLQK